MVILLAIVCQRLALAGLPAYVGFPARAIPLEWDPVLAYPAVVVPVAVVPG